MATIQCKHIEDEEFNARDLLDTFCGNNIENAFEELITFPLQQFHEIFSSGHVKGDTLIDASIGPMIYQLFSACEVFKDITFLEFTDHNMREFEKWLNNEDESYKWSHILQHVCHLENNASAFKEKEEKLRKAVKRALMCDLTKSNPVEPVVLEKADCILSIWSLNKICKDKDSYKLSIKNLSSLLKLGGHLILTTVLNCTYYKLRDNHFFVLQTDEKFIRDVLSNAGYAIEKFCKLPRSCASHIANYEHAGFIVAKKVKEIQ